MINTEILIASLPSEFHPAFPGYPDKPPMSCPVSTASILAEFSSDAMWLLQNGNSLGGYEDTNEIYDTWLRAKGFRGWNGKTWHKKLYSDIADFYGQDFLSILDAHDTGIRPWSQRLLQQQDDLSYPMYHLILIRFLAGPAATFFQCECEKPLPFGKAPWPCRNKICKYHLEDVIERIDLKCVKGIYKATFPCPHCGMTYRRKSAIPKEMQYAGQIDVIDYGWLWKERLKELLIQDTPITVIAKALYCDIHTVLKFGVDFGLVPQERLKQRKPYIPKGTPSKDPSRRNESKEFHRDIWKETVSAHPEASRSELIHLAHKNYEWLRANDLEWFEKNSPAPKKSTADWSNRDDEYVELIKAAVSQIKDSQEKPIWINMSSVSRKSGIANLHGKVASGKLPKAAAYLEQNLETMAEWRKRKILWAVRMLMERGEKLTLNKITLTAAISRGASKELEPFILKCMEIC